MIMNLKRRTQLALNPLQTVYCLKANTKDSIVLSYIFCHVLVVWVMIEHILQGFTMLSNELNQHLACR